MEAISNAFAQIVEYPHKFTAKNGRDFLDAYPDYPVYSTIIYLCIVFYLPGYLERNNIKFRIKYVVAGWNLFLSLASTYGVYYTFGYARELMPLRIGHNNACELIPIKGGDDLITRRANFVHARRKQIMEERNLTDNWQHSTPDAHELITPLYDGQGAFAVAMFAYLKTPELLDTLFLILQDKPVSFLHWYHHIVTAIYVWLTAYMPIPAGIAFCAMNYFVHSIMYFYYFLVVLGLRKTIRPFAPVITLLQVIQMVLGWMLTGYTYLQFWLAPEFSHTLFYKFCRVVFTHYNTFYYHVQSLYKTGSLAKSIPTYSMQKQFWGCDTDPTNLRVCMTMYASYVVLFAVLFKELYLDKRAHENSLVLKRKARAAAAKAERERKEASMSGVIKQG